MINPTIITPPPKQAILPVIAVTLLAFTATLIAGYITEQAVANRLNDFFNRQADQIANTYYSKLHTHTTILEGLRGLWNANGSFSYHSFTQYVESLDLNSLDKSGVSSYFYAPAVKNNQATSFISQVKKEPNLPTVYQTLNIHPKSQSDYYYPAIYAVPLKDRESSIGLDFATFPERIAAINYARDHNALATTNHVTLLTTGKSGFFFLLPLYQKSTSLERTRERQDAFAGVIGAAFRSESAFEQIFGTSDPYPYLDFQIYQGESTDPDRLLHDHDGSFTAVNPSFSATRIVRLKNQTWTITVQGKPSLSLGNSEQRLPLMVFAFGIVMTITLGIFSAYKLAQIHQTR